MYIVYIHIKECKIHDYVFQYVQTNQLIFNIQSAMGNPLVYVYDNIKRYFFRSKLLTFYTLKSHFVIILSITTLIIAVSSFKAMLVKFRRFM